MTPMNRPSASDQTAAVRGQILDTLGHLAQAAQTYELPAPPGVLANGRRKLQENRYTVLVAGEAKRGKSTFVNAILRIDLLPTDVDVATSHAFRLNQAAS